MPGGQLWKEMTQAYKQAQLSVDVTIEPRALAQGQSADDKLFAALASGQAWDLWQRDIPPSYQQPLVESSRRRVLVTPVEEDRP